MRNPPLLRTITIIQITSKLSSSKFSGEGTIKLLSYAPNKLVYSADVKGKQLAIFSEIYYPNGWKAFVDNKEVEIRKVNYLLRGLELAGGKHKIEFKYDSKKYRTANSISAISSTILLLSIAFLIFLDWKRRRSKKEINKL